MTYLEDAADHYRRASAAANGMVNKPGDRAAVHLRVAEGFTRLAAIEAGIVPADWQQPAGDHDDAE